MNTDPMHRFSLFLPTLILPVLLLGTAESYGLQKKPNVVFICIDDMRPDLGCYGDSVAHSPNLDALASSATVFSNHFAVVPTCGASRASLLTGKLPKTVQDLSNEACVTNKRTDDQYPETFIAHLKNNGYYTVGIGKISHYTDGYVYPYDSMRSDRLELPNSWNEMLFDPGKWGTGWNAFFGYADGSNRQSEKGNVPPYEKADVADNGYPDGLTADLAVRKIGELAKGDNPFFLSVGFFKPHLPFTAPAKYWDLIDSAKIQLTPSPAIPEHVNRTSLHNSGEFNQYLKGDEKATLDSPLTDAYARKLRHAYYACIAYTDAQIGRIMQALDRHGLTENTVVVVWSDHGWHLGDHRVWGKHTLFERSLKNVLIIKEPGAKGQVCNQVVSSVDIYPTVVALCKVAPVRNIDGQSLVPLLRNPQLPSWRNTAYSYFNRGISLFTPDDHLIRYFREDAPAMELYSRQEDRFENINIAGHRPEILQKLLTHLENDHQARRIW